MAKQVLETSHPAAATGLQRRISDYALLVMSILFVAFAVRFSFVYSADFPLNDGGLFYAMVRDLQANGYRLPAFTSYNAAGIPFAYPPLGFYVTGLLDDSTPLGILDLLRILPLAMSMLTVVAFFYFARSMLSSRLTVLFALLAFALLPRSFQWQIMGGGLTRSLGFFFAVLALHQGYQMFRGGQKRHLLATIALSAATALSHIEMAWFLAYSLGFMFLAYGRTRTGAAKLALVGVGAALGSALWWDTVMVQHGPRPFLAAMQHGTAIWRGLYLVLADITQEPYFPILAATALVGLLACIRVRRLEIGAWLLLMFILDPRKAPTTASVPLALLAGIGAAQVLFPVLPGWSRLAESLAGERDPDRAEGSPTDPCPRSRAAEAVVGFFVVYSLLSSTLGYRQLLAALPPAEREAMEWVKEHTEAGSSFLVVTADNWAADKSSEWFPVLADRGSVATVQGSEWLDHFPDKIEQYRQLQECARRDAGCLETWSRDNQKPFTHIYLSKRPAALDQYLDEYPCWPLDRSLRLETGYQLLYDAPEVAVFQRGTP